MGFGAVSCCSRSLWCDRVTRWDGDSGKGPRPAGAPRNGPGGGPGSGGGRGDGARPARDDGLHGRGRTGPGAVRSTGAPVPRPAARPPPPTPADPGSPTGDARGSGGDAGRRPAPSPQRHPVAEAVDQLLARYDRALTDLSAEPAAAADPAHPLHLAWSSVVAPGTALAADLPAAIIAGPATVSWWSRVPRAWPTATTRWRWCRRRTARSGSPGVAGPPASPTTSPPGRSRTTASATPTARVGPGRDRRGGCSTRSTSPTWWSWRPGTAGPVSDRGPAGRAVTPRGGSPAVTVPAQAVRWFDGPGRRPVLGHRRPTVAGRGGRGRRQRPPVSRGTARIVTSILLPGRGPCPPARHRADHLLDHPVGRGPGLPPARGRRPSGAGRRPAAPGRRTVAGGRRVRRRRRAGPGPQRRADRGGAGRPHAAGPGPRPGPADDHRAARPPARGVSPTGGAGAAVRAGVRVVHPARCGPPRWTARCPRPA